LPALLAPEAVAIIVGDRSTTIFLDLTFWV
jgi:hypothetical protein